MVGNYSSCQKKQLEISHSYNDGIISLFFLSHFHFCLLTCSCNQKGCCRKKRFLHFLIYFLAVGNFCSLSTGRVKKTSSFITVKQQASTTPSLSVSRCFLNFRQNWRRLELHHFYLRYLSDFTQLFLKLIKAFVSTPFHVYRVNRLWRVKWAPLLDS